MMTSEDMLKLLGFFFSASYAEKNSKSLCFLTDFPEFANKT